MSLWNHLLCKRAMVFIHEKCRNVEVPYLRSSVFRIPVSDDKVKWSMDFEEYNPPDYSDPSSKGKPWSDDSLEGLKWNAVDGKINRKSHIVDYAFDADGRPLNPMGRTGLKGRGTLGRWGPNHAADPVVSRVKNGQLQFVAIKRGDTGEWAIPGGMVDAGECISATLRREFTEETLGGKDIHLDKLWESGKELYKGYVDDPRNTDNAWMETVVMNFHDDKGILDKVNFEAGDDAVAVRWVNVLTGQKLYASHEKFIELLRAAHENEANV